MIPMKRTGVRKSTSRHRCVYSWYLSSQTTSPLMHTVNALDDLQSNHGHKHHDLSILFLFSLLLSRSTRFLCILTSIFSYRSRSAFAARLSLMAWIRFYANACKRAEMRIEIATRKYLTFGLFFVLHFSLLGLCGRDGFRIGSALLVADLAGGGPKGRAPLVPVLAWKSYCQSRREAQTVQCADPLTVDTHG